MLENSDALPRATRPTPRARTLMLLAMGVPTLLLGMILADGGALSARTTVQAPPARVCIVDLERVFDSAPQRDSMEASLRARDEEIKKIADEAKEEIERLKGELALLEKGHSEYLAKERELNTKQSDLRFQAEQWNREMTDRMVAARNDLLEQIRVVVQTVCDTEGFDIVLQRDFKIPDTPVVWSTAFYSRPEYDITDRVIAGLE